MKKIAAVLLLSAAVAAPAFAADNGFYAGVTLGRSRTNTLVSGATMTKSNDTVGGVLAGYQFTRNWGAEAFYTGAGKYSATGNVGAMTLTGSGKADSFGAVAVGTVPLSDAFSLYGKLGVARTKTSAIGTIVGLGSISIGATRSTATYGLGGQYNATPAVGVRFGWDRYGATHDVVGTKFDFNTNVYSLGAVFKF